MSVDVAREHDAADAANRPIAMIAPEHDALPDAGTINPSVVRYYYGFTNSLLLGRSLTRLIKVLGRAWVHACWVCSFTRVTISTSSASESTCIFSMMWARWTS